VKDVVRSTYKLLYTFKSDRIVEIHIMKCSVTEDAVQSILCESERLQCMLHAHGSMCGKTSGHNAI